MLKGCKVCVLALSEIIIIIKSRKHLFHAELADFWVIPLGL